MRIRGATAKAILCVVGATALSACGSTPPASTSTTVLGAPKSVSEAVFTVATPPVPGTPARFDKVSVRRFGSPDATHVLVLVPGTQGGAGDFDIVAPYLATHVPDLQVWAEMRREGSLQDESLVESTLAGKTTYRQAFDYYLGWITDPGITHHYRPLNAADYEFTEQWGMAVAMDDLHAVVVKAGDHGKRTVTLGGHSLGGTEAAVYAAWDFSGKPGYAGINGIMCIDGCAGPSDPSAPAETVTSVRRQIGGLSTKGPWLDLLGFGLPWTTGAFSQVGALAALEAPGASATLLQSFSALPKEFKPDKPVTNQAILGYAFDASTSPKKLDLIHVHSGHVAPSGSPAKWIDDGITPIRNVADVFAQAPLGGAEWYFPERLSIDAGVAASLTQTPAARYLGLRILHTGQVDVPLYAFQTSLGGAGNAVADQADAYKRVSKISSVEVVSCTQTYSHLDPLLASPDRNAFLESVVPWLEKIDS